MQKALSCIVSSFAVSECDFFPSYRLAQSTTLRIGGTATMLASPKSEEALLRLLRLLSDYGIPRYLIGNGSNLLAPDEGYCGVVIRTGALRTVSVRGNSVFAAAGASLASVAHAAAIHGIGGFPALSGIPATVGGALFMNAGAGDATIGERVVSVRVAPPCGGEPFTLLRDECHFAYRKSIFQRRGMVILSCELTGPPTPPAELFSAAAEFAKKRRATQPLDLPSAGSVFLRPKGDAAGRLIEAAGLKGARIGGAAVSERHAGFIVNAGGATAADFRALVERVRAEVLAHSGVALTREIEYMGEG